MKDVKLIISVSDEVKILLKKFQLKNRLHQASQLPFQVKGIQPFHL